MPKNIRVVGLDADGCIFNQTFINLLTEEIKNNGLEKLTEEKVYELVIKANEKFFGEIINKNKEYDKTILCITSNRQSRDIDYENSEKLLSGILKSLKIYEGKIDSKYVSLLSFMKTMNMLSLNLLNPHRGDYFEKSLIADLFGMRDLGSEDKSFIKVSGPSLIPSTSYYIALSCPDFENHPHAPLDYSKTLLLINLLRKIRIDNPEDIIEFEMYDDRCEFPKSTKSPRRSLTP